jgi:inorganic pyrophosphatase
VVIKCDLLGALRVTQKDLGGEALRNDRYILCPQQLVHRESTGFAPASSTGATQDINPCVPKRHGTTSTGEKIRYTLPAA